MHDRAFEWLVKAVDRSDPGLGSIALHPVLDSLRSDPRRLGKAPGQKAAISFDVTVPK